MSNNFDKLFNQAQGNELINALKGIKSSLDVNYPLETVNVTLSNNNQTIVPSANYYGLEQVNVPGINLSDMTILVNGNYDPVTSGFDGYGKLNVNVPNTYGASDEGKVVDNGALVAQTSQNITENGTYDTTLKDEVVVNVAGGGGGGSQIIKGTSNPSSSDGSNNDLYLKYHEGYPETTYTRAIKDLAMTSDDYTDSNNYRFIASASSIYGSGQNPYRAFNGTNTGGTDCWHPTNGTPQWIQLQFPQKIVITEFTIYNRQSNVEHPTAFTVQGSDDGTNWTDLVQVSWSETGSGIHKDVTVPPSENGYYYYRLYITGVTSSPYGVIGEIEFTELHEPNAQVTSQIADEVFVKVNGTWMDIIGADVSEVTSGGGSSKQYGAPRITVFKNIVGVESEEVSN